MVYPFPIRQIYKISRDDMQNGGGAHTLNQLCCGLESEGGVPNGASGIPREWRT